MEISQEARASLTTIFLPPHSGVIPGADDTAPTDEQDIAYNAWCTQAIKDNLLAIQKVYQDDYDRARKERDAAIAAVKDDEPIPARLRQPLPQPGPPLARTRYPSDDEGSEDVVSLDRDGEVVVIDVGTR